MVLVTGGTGLLGSHLLYDLVKAGKRVRAIKREGADVATTKKIFSYYSTDKDDLFQKIEWVDADVLDIYSILSAMEGVKDVYHCAAIVSFNPKDFEIMNKVNVEGTANMVNAALEKKIRKFCFVSSIATLGRNVDTKEITEETFWKSSPHNSNYSISKYSAEREVWRAVQEGLSAVIVNPSVIVGPGNWNKTSSNMFSTAFNGLKFYTEGITGFVDVRDVSRIMIQLTEGTIENERFIVSSENASFRKFFEFACKNLNKKRPYIKAGKFLSEVAWIADKFKGKIISANPLITKETARAAHQINLFSNKKIIEQLNFKFISLEQSIEDTCKLFLKDRVN